ncbi:MAG: ParB/RepB/Spo0J family partition protein [Ferruginibacter sp.]|nr:ParB/RepB/Spo0J family partition protein [Ferruginibacter sp.]
MQQKKDALGKGIRSLLQNIDADLKTTAGNLKSEIIEKAAGTTLVPIDKIDTNPDQPRKDFNEIALSELAASIKIHGIIQPLTVSAIPNGRYRLIAGERRYRASKIAGLKEVPVYIRQSNDDNILELALLENLQRENLNAIEIGLSYKRLMDDLDYSADQLSERMGKDRSTVTNYVRLLKLPPDVQVAVRNRVITMAHARSIISLDVVDKQLFAFSEIKKKGLSVRQTEELVRKLTIGPSAKPTAKTAAVQNEYKKIEDNIASQYGTKVKLNHNKKGHGTILFEYYSLEQLNSLLEKLKANVS